MAGNFYTIDEVSQILDKTEQEVKQLVQEGKIREFRDGSKLLFKKEEIDSVKTEMEPLTIDINLEDTGFEEPTLDLDETPESAESDKSSLIGLAPLDETSEHKSPLEETKRLDNEMSSMIELSEADTNIGDGEGINVLGDSDTNMGLLSDSLADTQETGLASEEGNTEPVADIDADADLGKLDADINLDSFGSGSGLLDLSLQADDTSLGAVLDDILPGAGGDEAGGVAMDDFGLGDEDAGDLMAEASGSEAEAITEPEEETEDVFGGDFAESVEPVAAAAPAAYTVEVVEDPASNAFGSMLFMPMVAMVLLAIAVMAGLRGVSPSLMLMVQSYVWYIMGGVLVLAFVIMGVGMAMTGPSKPKAPKAPKAKKPKKAKKAK